MPENQTTTKPTKRMCEFLQWAHAKGEFTTWPIEFSTMQRRADKAGYIELSGRRERGVIGFVAYRLSSLGKAALS